MESNAKIRARRIWVARLENQDMPDLLLWQRWRWLRWVILGIGVLLLVGRFMLFEFRGQYTYADAFQSPLILSMLGGGMIGSSVPN